MIIENTVCLVIREQNKSNLGKLLEAAATKNEKPKMMMARAVVH